MSVSIVKDLGMRRTYELVEIHREPSMPPFLGVGETEVRQLRAGQPQTHQMVVLEVLGKACCEAEEAEVGVEKGDQDFGAESEGAANVDAELPDGGAGA